MEEYYYDIDVQEVRKIDYIKLMNENIRTRYLKKIGRYKEHATPRTVIDRFSHLNIRMKALEENKLLKEGDTQLQPHEILKKWTKEEQKARAEAKRDFPDIMTTLSDHF